MIRKFAVFISKLFFGIFFRVELINSEYIPKTGPAMVCSTHNNMLDMFLLGYRLDRWIYWMAKEELFKNPIGGYIFRQLGAFPIKRGKGDVGSIKAVYRHFEEGHLVGIFPQGTRVKTKNKKSAAIKSGAALLAINAGVQIVPANISGNYKLFGKIRVVFGQPFMLENENGQKLTSEELSEKSKGIMEKIYSLTESAN